MAASKKKPWWKSRTVWGSVGYALTECAPQVFPTPEVLAVAKAASLVLTTIGLRYAPPTSSPRAR